MQDRSPASALPFMKMHGLGNDFVVIDRRRHPVAMTTALARAIGDRHWGVGFDQLALIDGCDDADLRLTFYNQDGSTSATCGNATRCIAAHEMAARGTATLTLRTERGLLAAERTATGGAVVNLGQPMTGWADVPLAHELDTLHLPIDGDPVATGMGNPHCSFIVPDASAVDLAAIGAKHEHHPLFPERTNVEVVEVLAADRLRLRIWERGVGITSASGSCAAAAAVATARRGLADRKVTLAVDGGEMTADWRDDGVWVGGPTAHVFDGVLRADVLAQVGLDG
jgi:diaminopimelate epimerase